MEARVAGPCRIQQVIRTPIERERRDDSCHEYHGQHYSRDCDPLHGQVDEIAHAMFRGTISSSPQTAAETPSLSAARPGRRFRVRRAASPTDDLWALSRYQSGYRA